MHFGCREALSRGAFLQSFAAAALRPAAFGAQPPAERKLPDFVIILTDGQGYAGVGCLGAPRMKTPRLERKRTRQQQQKVR